MLEHDHVLDRPTLHAHILVRAALHARTRTLEDETNHTLTRLWLVIFVLPDVQTSTKPDALMYVQHMIIARCASVKERHADPADMRFAAKTRHMIAPFRLLHGCFALGTILDVEFFLQLLECFLTT